jgi:hypothetical protein
MLRSIQPRWVLGLAAAGALAACTGTIGTTPAGGGNQPSSTPSSNNNSTTVVPSGGACGADQIGPSPLHRLTHTEYDNSIKDLVGQDLKLSDSFSFDERAGIFTANFFEPITETQFDEYATAAETAAEAAVKNMGQVVPCNPTADAAACELQFIKQFGRRAYRRPLDDTEVAALQKLFDLGRTGVDFANGVRLVVQATLQSPKFLYLIEGPGPLNQHQLAARLSYFLWNAPPDAPLASAADAGQLGDLNGLRQQTQRMLKDPRSLEVITEFTNQWLGLDDWMTKDPMLYPQFTTMLPMMIEETTRFLGEVMNTDGGRLDTLLTSPWSIVNGPLAKLYGASDAYGAGPGTDWRKTTLDPKQRAGLLTQAAFLAAQGEFDGSSPIRRGLAVRERILCAPMPMPPPGVNQNVPPLTPSQTTRERFDKHRTDPQCAACHDMMDKLGYGFEEFDGIGAFRTNQNGVQIDDSGELIATDIDGPFVGAPDLVHKLVASPQVQRCVATQWFRYALGRLDTSIDKCEIDAISKRVMGGDIKIADMMQAIVESDTFRTFKAAN